MFNVDASILNKMGNQGKKNDEDTPPAGMRNQYNRYAEVMHREKMPSNSDVGNTTAMMMKIDMIGSNQERMLEKLDKFSDAMYDPEKGLFMRLTKVEVSTQQMTEKLDNHVKFNDEKSEKDEGEITKIQKILEPIPELLKWKDRLNKSALWLASGMGTAVIGLIAKMLYDVWAAKHGLPK